MSKSFKEIYQKVLIGENIEDTTSIDKLLESLDEVLATGKSKTIELNGEHSIEVKRNNENCIEIYTNKNETPLITFDNENKCDLISLGKLSSLAEYIKMKGIEESFEQKYSTLISTNEGADKLMTTVAFVEKTGLPVSFYVNNRLYTVELNNESGVDITTPIFKDGTVPFISFDEDKTVNTTDYLNAIKLSDEISKYGMKKSPDKKLDFNIFTKKYDAQALAKTSDITILSIYKELMQKMDKVLKEGGIETVKLPNGNTLVIEKDDDGKIRISNTNEDKDMEAIITFDEDGEITPETKNGLLKLRNIITENPTFGRKYRLEELTEQDKRFLSILDNAMKQKEDMIIGSNDNQIIISPSKDNTIEIFASNSINGLKKPFVVFKNCEIVEINDIAEFEKNINEKTSIGEKMLRKFNESKKETTQGINIKALNDLLNKKANETQQL